MGESASRPVPELLYYRPWQGSFRPPSAGVWPVARTALGLLLRPRFFWVLYACGLLIFLAFFFGQYLLALAQAQISGADADTSFFLRALLPRLRKVLRLDGSPESYRQLFQYQGHMLMIILALAGSIVIGNDLRFGSLPYYLAKPLSRGHYLLGKGLAVAFLVNMLTTIPALIIYLQYLLISPEGVGDPRYQVALVFGILGYGLLLTMVLTILLLATATWLRQTVPLIMAWATLFFFFRLVAAALVDGLNLNRHWRLIDLWNDMVLVGSACLGLDPSRLRPPPQPPWGEAALILTGVCIVCLTYLIRRIQAVEVVR
jgi:ABC-2 type transport system permease protein